MGAKGGKFGKLFFKQKYLFTKPGKEIQ